MPTNFSDALKEAYAYADNENVEYGTFELHHENLATPARVCLGFEEVSCRLEAGAPVDGGNVVTFTPAPIDVKPPDIISGEEPQMDVTIYAIDHEIIESLEAASEADPAPLTIYYRVYLARNLLVGPEAPFPLKMFFRNPKVDVTAGTIAGRATYKTLANRSFPYDNYTAARFPGLKRY